MIILVGHTYDKMKRTLSLLPSNIDKFLVYNGKENFPGALKTKNCSTGRDIYMYNLGLEKTNWERVYFINDDVEYIHPSFWDNIQYDEDIIGVANLASWIPESLQNSHTKKQGRQVRFIRTSAFLATRNFFDNLYLTYPEAQRFEKHTLNTANYRIVSPIQYYDSNVKQYYIKIYGGTNS